MLAPGQKASTILDIPDSGLEYLCSLPGHKEAGMSGTITVNSEGQHAKSKATTLLLDVQVFITC